MPKTTVRLKKNVGIIVKQDFKKESSMQKYLLPMELQLFADGEENTTEDVEPTNSAAELEKEPTNEEVKPEVEKEEEKKYTQEQVDKMIQDRLARVKSKVDKSEEDTTTKDLAEEIKSLKEQQLVSDMENYALKKGMKEEDISKILRVAKTYEEEDYKKAIDTVIEEYGFGNKVSISTGTQSKTETEKKEPTTLYEAIEAEIAKGKK